MDVLLNAVQIALEHVHFVHRQALPRALGLSNVVDGLEVLILVEAGHVTRIQNVVDVFQHLLVDDLRVHEEERGRFGLHASLHQAGLSVLSPVAHGVTLNDLDLIKLEVRDGRRQLAETLTT